MARQEEQNESLTRQLEQLNTENEDLHQRMTELTSSLSSMQLERDTLQLSLKNNSERSLNMQNELGTVVEVQNDTPQNVPLLAAGVLGVNGEENATTDTVQTESRQQEIDDLHARISDSTSQISKLIDQLSISSNEKTTLATKLESATLELSAMKDKYEAQTSKISQLEASIKSLIAERDAAVAEVSARNLMLSTSPSEKNELMSVVNEKCKEILSLESERAHALAKTRGLEDAVEALQNESKRLVAELDSSKAEISKLSLQIELASQRQTSDELKNDAVDCALDSDTSNVVDDEYKAKINSLQCEINNLKDAHTQLEREKLSFKALPQITIEEIQKLKADMAELRENNILLQEAVQGNIYRVFVLNMFSNYALTPQNCAISLLNYRYSG